MTVVTYLKNMPAWARWMLYAVVGVFVLNVVQGFDDTSLLTAEGTIAGDAAVGRADPAGRSRRPVRRAGRRGQHRPRRHDDARHLVRRMGRAAVRAVVGTVARCARRRRWADLLHAIATVQFGVDHVISGVAINILGPGVARFLSSEIFAEEVQGAGGSITQSPRVPTVGRFTFPFLAGGDLFGWKTPDILGWFEKKDWFFVSDIAGIARGLTSNMSWVTLFALVMVPFSAWLLWRTRFGLRLRICGERPEAGEAQGINIYFYKYVGVIISGALAGLAGAFIASQELSGIYKEGQTTGRGFIGMAALIFGNWRPTGIFGGAMLFGYPFALKLQDLNGKASHALLLVTAIAMFAVMVWAMLRKNTQRHGAGRSVRRWLRWRGTCSPRPHPTGGPRSCRTSSCLVVLIFFTKRLRPPAADGQVYRKGEALGS